jgi:Flp pilus assembly pilin Flp
VLAGVTPHEIGLVLFLLALVVVAPKVGKIGEWLGGLFERRGGAGGGAAGGEARPEGGAPEPDGER